MTREIIECVPNFSEGRRKQVLDELKQASAPARLLDLETDFDHNRSVMTLVGTREELQKAVINVAEIAIKRIDLNNHKGEHPRMGAVDVIPFVPVSGCTMQDCIDIAIKVGKQLAERFDLPIFLYEHAATRPGRKNLADVRKGEFENLRDLIGKDPAKTPDLGPNKIHPTAGATAVGARPFLIAYNVNLKTDDIKVAKKIATRVRERDGGLATVKALGMFIESRKMAQVSMNLCDYTVSSIKRAFDEVKKLAEEFGTGVNSSEVVGLLPQSALKNDWLSELKLENFNPEHQIIENRI